MCACVWLRRACLVAMVVHASVVVVGGRVMMCVSAVFVWCVCPPQGNSGIFFFDAEFSTKRNDDDDDDRATAGDKKLK